MGERNTGKYLGSMVELGALGHSTGNWQGDHIAQFEVRGK